MAIMKSKDEIGVYIKDRLKQIGLSQSDLAGKIAELKGDGYDKNSLKDNVSKWIRGARYPGTEYIYYLAQVLKVSIEEILVAGEVCDKYDDRPFTLYAIAKSGNRDAVDTVMTMQDEYGSCVGTNYDEYDKTLLDYIIQFENLDLLHYLIEKEYVSFFENQIMTTIRLGNTYSDVFRQIVSLAIKYDDIFVFQKAIKRSIPILLSKDEGFDEKLFIKNEYRAGYIIAYTDLLKISHTDKIFQYLTTPFIPTPEEWRQLNAGIIYTRRGTRDEQTEVRELETISASFNLLLNLSIVEKLPVAEKLIAIGIEHNEKVRKQLADIYSSDDYKIGSEGNVTVGHHFGSLTVFAGVIEKYYDEKKFQGLIKL